jgi:hypothetical protein
MEDKEKQQAAPFLDATFKEEAPAPEAPAKEEAPAVAPDADKTDSTGAPKDTTPLGPRGLNVPRGIKPEPPPAPEKNPVGGDTTELDSAGNQKQEAIPIGPRGAGAEKIARESFNHDARK